MQLAVLVARPLADVTIVGIAGGSVPFGFFSVPYEISLQTTYWGSIVELIEVLELARRGVDPPRGDDVPARRRRHRLPGAARRRGRAVAPSSSPDGGAPYRTARVSRSVRRAPEPVREPSGDVLLGAGRLADSRAALLARRGGRRGPRRRRRAWPSRRSASAASGSTSTARRSNRLASSRLQRRALAALDPATSLARRLEVRLAAETAYLLGDPAGVLAELERARQSDDPVVLAEALSLAHHCVLGPHHRTLRLQLADELIAVSPSTGRPIDGLMGLAWRTVDLVLAGDRRAGRSLAELRERLEVDRCDGLRYLADGDRRDAGRSAPVASTRPRSWPQQCYELGLDVGDLDALGWYGGQLVAIRWLQGRGDELLPLVRDIVNSTTIAEPAAGFVAAVAALAASIRRPADGAGAPSPACAPMGCGRWRRRAAGRRRCSASARPPTLLGDVDAAAEAYELLEPYADLPVICSLGVAVVRLGPPPAGARGVDDGRPRSAPSTTSRRRSWPSWPPATGRGTRWPWPRWPTSSTSGTGPVTAASGRAAPGGDRRRPPARHGADAPTSGRGDRRPSPSAAATAGCGRSASATARPSCRTPSAWST